MGNETNTANATEAQNTAQAGTNTGADAQAQNTANTAQNTTQTESSAASESTKKDMPSDEELAAFRKWQEAQKSDAEKHAAAIGKAEKARLAAEEKAALAELKVTALSKGIAYRLDLLLAVDYIRNAVIIGFCANEAISITENAALMGILRPKVILNAIEILRDKGESKK